MNKTKQQIYNKRPTSPHLSIYKPQISSTLSILHRMTGVALFFAFSILAWWFILSKFDSRYLSLANCCCNIKISLIAASLAWFYHLCNGIRHLFWDMGYGLAIKTVNLSGWTVVICSLLFTILLWV